MCCAMVVSIVKSGKGKPVVKVFEEYISQEISADANVAACMVDWRVFFFVGVDGVGQKRWLCCVVHIQQSCAF